MCWKKNTLRADKIDLFHPSAWLRRAGNTRAGDDGRGLCSVGDNMADGCAHAPNRLSLPTPLGDGERIPQKRGRLQKKPNNNTKTKSPPRSSPITNSGGKSQPVTDNM